MVSASKILTVSYGTFSCTLEGFDDSFDTMKAIAEYFRDLTADDRYFGAEPPTPDADMLARIAEREIARHVAAHEKSGRLVLRAGVDETPEEAPAYPDAEAATAVSGQDIAHLNIAEDVDSAAFSERDSTSSLEAHDTASSASLQTLENVDVPETIAPSIKEAFEARDVDQSDAAPITNKHDDALVFRATSTDAEKKIGKSQQRATDVSPVVHPNEVTAENVDFLDAKAFFTESSNEQTDINGGDIDATSAVSLSQKSSSPAFDPQPGGDVDDDSLTARLQRLRSVASENNIGFVNDETENESSQNTQAEVSAELSSLLMAEQDQSFYEEDGIDVASNPLATPDAAADDTVTPGAGAHAEPVQTYVDEDELSDFIADVVDRSAGPALDTPELDATYDTPQASLSDDPPNGADLTLPEIESKTAEVETRVETVDEAKSANEITEEGHPFILNEWARVSEEVAEVQPEPDMMNDGARDDERSAFDLSPEDEEELQRVLAEVEAGLDHASDAQANVCQDTASVLPSEDDLLEAHEIDPARENSLTAARPAERIRKPDEAIEIEVDILDLSAAPDVESDRETQDADPLDPPAVERDTTPEEPRVVEELGPAKGKLRRGLARLLGTGKRQNEEEERLFDEADHKMDEQDSNMRRTAIQHLRAAVAATRAEKKAGIDVDQDSDDGPYRTDLSRVVKPRRPDSASSPVVPRSQRPVEQRAAPLKLVAEQRVDLERPLVSPRRISTPDLTPPVPADGVGSGFTEFAQARGATELSELLEAAAAYMSDVEGLAEFSRPMLMRKLKEVQTPPYSREDGLRSFGLLLRTGKLRKLKGGRFAVTDETDYRNKARNVG